MAFRLNSKVRVRLMCNEECDRSSWFLERGLTPLIFLVVGFVQIYLAHTANLSPWKGGGFGMFAAIDAPSMRVLAAEGLDQYGQPLRLKIFDESTRFGMSALPRRTDLEQLASRLISQEVVPTTIRRQIAYEKLHAENPAIAIPKGERLLLRPIYRLRSLKDPIYPARTIKRIQAIRLQWWRLRFDPSQNRLWAEPLSQVVEAGKWK